MRFERKHRPAAASFAEKPQRLPRRNRNVFHGKFALRCGRAASTARTAGTSAASSFAPTARIASTGQPLISSFLGFNPKRRLSPAAVRIGIGTFAACANSECRFAPNTMTGSPEIGSDSALPVSIMPRHSAEKMRLSLFKIVIPELLLS